MKRGTDKRSDIQKRVRQARRELREAYQYDYIVVNDTVEKAVNYIIAIIQAEKRNIIRNKEVLRGVCSP